MLKSTNDDISNIYWKKYWEKANNAVYRDKLV